MWSILIWLIIIFLVYFPQSWIDWLAYRIATWLEDHNY